MRIQTIQNSSPSFNANLKIIDRFGILKGKGENASKNIYARFFSSKELAEARKLFKEKTKDIIGGLYINVHAESYRGNDISKIKLKQYPSKSYENSVPVSILDCSLPNKTVVFGNDVYNIADKPTFNRAHELKQDHNKIRQSALRTYVEKIPKLNEDSELVQKLDTLCKQKIDELAQGKTPRNELDLEIYKVLKQISDEEMRLEEELYKPVLGRKPKNLQQFVNGLVKILKILDRKGKNIDELIKLKEQVTALQTKVNKEGNSNTINKKIAKLKQKIDKIEFQMAVSDNIAVGKIFGTDFNSSRYIPFI